MTARILLPTALLLAACTPVSDEPAEGDARLEGRQITAASAVGDPARVATVWSVDASGELTDMGLRNRLDADGTFTLDVPVDEVEGQLVIRLEAGRDVVGHVLVSDRLRAGETTLLAPVTVETSVEAEAAIALRALGIWTSGVTTDAWLRGLVTAESAAMVDRHEERDDAVDVLARTHGTAMIAFHDAVGDSRGGAMAMALDSLATARAATDADLYDSRDAGKRGDVEAAFGTLVDSVWTDASLDTRTTAGAWWAASASTWTADTGLATVLTAETETHLAAALDSALRASAEALGAGSSTLTAIGNATAALQADLDAAAASPSPERDLAAAWAAFDADVRGLIEAEVPGLTLGALNSLETAVETSDDALLDAIANASLEATAELRAEAAVAALLQFRQDLETGAAIEALTTAGLSDMEARAMVDAYADLALTLR